MKPLRALMIEDSEDDALLIQNTLKNSGYDLRALRVDTEDDLQRALRDGQWDIVLSDYSLPSFDARRTLEILAGTGVDLPVIVVSGTVGEDVAVETLKLGADDYLLKQNLIRLGPAVARTLEAAEGRRQHRQKDEALRKGTALLEAQVESSPDGILVVDRHGSKVIQNRRFNEMWKIPPELASNQADALTLEFVAKRTRDPSEFAAKVSWLYAHPEEISRDVIELIDGTVLDRYSAPVLGNERHHYGRIWTFRDITAQRKADEQKAALEAQLRQAQKLEALGTLAGGIAHDFNNILTAIIMNQHLALLELEKPERIRLRLAGIAQGTDRAKKLVSQILAFSREKKPELQLQALEPIVHEVLEMVRVSLPAGIEVVQEFSPEAPPVPVDSTQIHQVVMNLCTNAVQAMRGRPGRLLVQISPRKLDEMACRTVPGLAPGDYVRLTVTDTGHGMEPAVLARIFEPFFTTKGPREGTGLGLAVVHGIMKDHQGGIAVHSRPGEGTTFELFFPEAAGNLASDRAAEADRHSGRGESILLVDDEEEIGRAIGDLLHKIGYEVETYCDPLTALERLRAAPESFALLLTDSTMPHLSGLELVAQARAVRPGLPALVMSGYGHTPKEAQGRDKKYRLLSKPFDVAELSRAVRQTLDDVRADST